MAGAGIDSPQLQLVPPSPSCRNHRPARPSPRIVSALRPIVGSFVVAPPSGARVRTRLRVDESETAVLWAVGAHLGTLAGTDLAARSAQGTLDARKRSESRRERKRALTASSSSRWAGAITRTSEDAWQLAHRNLLAERRSLASRVNRIARRLALPTGHRQKVRGYATAAERFEKQRRLQSLEHRLLKTERDITDGRSASAAALAALRRRTTTSWPPASPRSSGGSAREAGRLFLTADGDGDQLLGNLTIRCTQTSSGSRFVAWTARASSQPAQRPLPPVVPGQFPLQGEDVAAQATSARAI